MKHKEDVAVAGLRNWMIENNRSITKIVTDTGISWSTMHQIVDGNVSCLAKHTIDRLIDYTGLQYEELFGDVTL